MALPASKIDESDLSSTEEDSRLRKRKTVEQSDDSEPDDRESTFIEKAKGRAPHKRNKSSAAVPIHIPVPPPPPAVQINPMSSPKLIAVDSLYELTV